MFSLSKLRKVLSIYQWIKDVIRKDGIQTLHRVCFVYWIPSLPLTISAVSIGNFLLWLDREISHYLHQ
jgi:hypothetical protein